MQFTKLLGFLKVLSGIALTIVCWGMYGPAMHKGQQAMDGSRLRPFICVGLAYLVLSVVMPGIILGTQRELFQGWTFRGVAWSLSAGAAGAVGALGIIIAMTAGGKPTQVMPLVFGCAPVVSVFFSMWLTKTKPPTAWFYSGLILVSMGAAMVYYFQPEAIKPHGTAGHQGGSTVKDNKAAVTETSAR